MTVRGWLRRLNQPQGAGRLETSQPSPAILFYLSQLNMFIKICSPVCSFQQWSERLKEKRKGPSLQHSQSKRRLIRLLKMEKRYERWREKQELTNPLSAGM
jgi:hypothetical protein